jgi:hypothetical protein
MRIEHPIVLLLSGCHEAEDVGQRALRAARAGVSATGMKGEGGSPPGAATDILTDMSRLLLAASAMLCAVATSCAGELRTTSADAGVDTADDGGASVDAANDRGASAEGGTTLEASSGGDDATPPECPIFNTVPACVPALGDPCFKSPLLGCGPGALPAGQPCAPENAQCDIIILNCPGWAEAGPDTINDGYICTCIGAHWRCVDCDPDEDSCGVVEGGIPTPVPDE